MQDIIKAASILLVDNLLFLVSKYIQAKLNDNFSNQKSERFTDDGNFKKVVKEYFEHYHDEQKHDCLHSEASHHFDE